METTTQTAKPPTMRHRLRIATACFCLVLCVGFVALWVQSFFTHELIGTRAFGKWFIGISSRTGRATITLGPQHVIFFDKDEAKRGAVRKEWRWVVIPVDNQIRARFKAHEQITDGFLGFNVTGRLKIILRILIPHWSLVLLTGTLAIVLKPKPRLKFSLRELLLLTTITAVVLGAVAALGRSGRWGFSFE